MGRAGIVAVVFTDLVGSTEAVSRLGQERAEELRQAHFALLRDAIAGHGGAEVKNLGDGLMVAFGAASDAVACAVDMQQSLARHNRRGGEALVMRVGIAVGEATEEDGDYFGTPVIEASRLCARAAGGEILATEMVNVMASARCGDCFVALGPVELKGLPAPVSVHRVRWEDSADTAPPLPPRLPVDRSLGFIGRVAERELLEEAWKHAEQGALQVVLVGGEPGIGKTRLATEAALHAHRQSGLVLLGGCDEDLAMPYQPFVEALEHLLVACPEEKVAGAVADRGGELARLLPDLSRRVPGLASPQQTDPETERYLLFSAVGDLLISISRWRPVLLLLDDLHWAGAPTLLLLKHLIRSGGSAAMLVVGTYRDSEIGRGHPLTGLLAELRRMSGVERLSLRGLSDVEAVQMMESLAGHDLEGSELAFAHAVYAEADGSPFFMREILRHFSEAGDLIKERDRWTFRGEISEIPDSVREVIGQRLARLPDPLDRLLTLAAVIGREFDVAVLAPLAGLDQIATVDYLAEACRATLVREVKGVPGRFTFEHALIRHTIYDELGPARRMAMHRQVGGVLESLGGGDAYLSDLAHHWVAATPTIGVEREDAVKAARYAADAGRRAMASLAYEEAIRHFQGAVDAARLYSPDAQIASLLIQLGEAQRCAGDPAHRETLLEAGRLAHEAGDVEGASRAALANHRVLFSSIGTVDRARADALEAALSAHGAPATSLRALLLAALSTELHFEGQERRLALAREALGIARQLDDPSTLAKVLAALWLAAGGSTVEGLRGPVAEELSALAADLGDRALEFHAGVTAFLTATEQGDLAPAGIALSNCERIAEALGQPLLLWRVAYLQSHWAMITGRFDEVERWSPESERRGEAAGQPDTLPFARSPITVTRLLQGRAREALERVAPAAEKFPNVPVLQGMRGWALAEIGRTDEARTILTRLCANLPTDYMRLIVLSISTRTCTTIGETALAGELYDQLVPFRSAMVSMQSTWIGPASHELGLLATLRERYDDAHAFFAEAAAVEDRIGARPAAVHTRLEWARMLLRRQSPGDTETARQLLTDAKAGARDLHLPAVEARIDEVMTA